MKKISSRLINRPLMLCGRGPISFPEKTSKGFTLIELLVTVAILAFGIVTIYEALFISVDTFGYYVNYLETQEWVNEKISEKNAELTQNKMLEPGEDSGEIIRNHKTFRWTSSVSVINEEQHLYRIYMTLSWNQGSKTVRISRTAYLLPAQLKTYEESFV